MAAFNCIQKLKKEENKWQMRARFPILLSVASGFQERAVPRDFCCMVPLPCSSICAEPLVPVVPEAEPCWGPRGPGPSSAVGR